MGATGLRHLVLTKMHCLYAVVEVFLFAGLCSTALALNILLPDLLLNLDLYCEEITLIFFPPGKPP